MSATASLPVETRPQSIKVPMMPPRLKARLEFFKITPPNFAPVYDRIFVCPIVEKGNDQTAGGIVLAETTRDGLSAQRGLLMAAGAKAIEQLYAHGLTVGDIVVCVRFSPHLRKYMVKGHMHEMLVLRASEVMGGEDLQAAYDSGDKWLEMDAEGNVELCDREGGRSRVDPEDNPEGF